MNLHCLIVDDESLARELLEAYVNRLDGIQVHETCKNTFEAAKVLEANSNINLLFLDVQMPHQTGIEFLKNLSVKPKVILTTAFSNYAVEAFDLDITDYLMKPIDFKRLEKAVEKVKTQIYRSEKLEFLESRFDFENDFLIIKEGYDKRKIFLKEILYIQSMREYVTYHTLSGRFMELKPISRLESELPENHFIRIHRSFMVAKHAIRQQKANSLILENGSEIPISRSYRSQLTNFLF